MQLLLNGRCFRISNCRCRCNWSTNDYATLQYQEAIVDPTGQELTANDGTADLDANTIAEVSATSAATWNGNFAWGYGVWGNEQITTLAMSMQEGDVDPAPDVSLTGNAAAMFLGEETGTITADLG
jgi:hypothetical protein